MKDCKTCKHTLVLYHREKGDRFTAVYAPIDYVRCHSPRYNGRAYFCKANRKACAEYEKRHPPREPASEGIDHLPMPAVIAGAYNDAMAALRGPLPECAGCSAGEPGTPGWTGILNEE